MGTSRRGGIYCRISLNKGEKDDKKNPIPKVEAQEQMCRALAKDHEDIEVVKVYVDDGISAYAFKNRPGWAELLADVHAGKIDVVLAQAEDRLSRQPMEKEALILGCAANGITFLTVNDGATDPATADGAFMSGLRGLLGRMESQKMSTRKKQANAARRAAGVIPRGGPRPFGWADDRKALNESEAVMVRQAFEDLLSGARTVSAIATHWNSLGILTTRSGRWDIPRMTALLRRPRNAGIVAYGGVRVLDDAGEPVSANFERIISEETFNAAMAILDNPARRLTKRHTPKRLMASLAICGTCGKKMRSGLNRGVPVYRCSVHSGVGHKQDGLKHPLITADLLDEAVTKAVVSAVLLAGRDVIADPDAETLNSLHVRLGEIRKQEARLLDLIEAETFSVTEVAGKRAVLRQEAEEAERGIVEIAQRNARAALLADVHRSLVGKIDMDEVVKVKKQIRERFEAMELAQQRALVRGMVNIVVQRGRGAGRVEVDHLVAKGLNGVEEFEGDHFPPAKAAEVA